MRLPIGAPAAAARRAYLWFRATFACFLADEKAFKELSCAKGASGVKICLSCENVVCSQRYPTPESIPRGSRLVHFSNASIEQCKAHPRNSVLDIAAFLKAKAAQIPPVSPAEFEEIEKKTWLQLYPAGAHLVLHARRRGFARQRVLGLDALHLRQWWHRPAGSESIHASDKEPMAFTEGGCFHEGRRFPESHSNDEVDGK